MERNGRSFGEDVMTEEDYFYVAVISETYAGIKKPVQAVVGISCTDVTEKVYGWMRNTNTSNTTYYYVQIANIPKNIPGFTIQHKYQGV